MSGEAAIWYVAYGSNLFRERFACYLSGGGQGAARTHLLTRRQFCDVMAQEMRRGVGEGAWPVPRITALLRPPGAAVRSDHERG
ncbi:hypothetical protein ACFY4C_29095 [Actinomadura viridis]|uniref:hypothetical protein n=1 Tax=Actinomadura viridis TaxID=58110 RepID=UPI0036C86D18